MKFYFTYGTTDNMPFIGGWTEIEAPDRETACKVFRLFHPDKIKGLLNCSSVYDEKAFKDTCMAKVGNFNYFCHERISLTRELLDEVTA